MARPLIIPIFIPDAGCPHRCVYCNQKKLTGRQPALPEPKEIRRQALQFRAHSRKDRFPVQLSFYGGNFLGLNVQARTVLLQAAGQLASEGIVDSLRFSTRPDTIDQQSLASLSGFPIQTIELGIQSLDNAVLAAAGRGHTAKESVAAVKRLKEAGYQIGLQMMVGLPEDSHSGSLETARGIMALQPDFVRIYPTLVLEDTRLADWYRAGKYRPMELAACVKQVREIYQLFESQDIPVIRMGLQATEMLGLESGIIAGPWHPAFGHLVHSARCYERAAEAIRQMPATAAKIALHIHPHRLSQLRGHGNGNLKTLKKVFGLDRIRVCGDLRLSEHEVVARPDGP